PIYDSAKRTHHFGGRILVYYPYSQVLRSFAGPICRWVRFGKRTQNKGSMRAVSTKSGFVSGGQSHFPPSLKLRGTSGVTANAAVLGNSLRSSIIGNGARRRQIDLESQFSQSMELVQQRATAEAQRLGSFCPIKIVFAQGEEDGVS